VSGVAQAAYTGRFAPSPTGPLHAGSLVAALGSWLDARARAGRWLVRIEDVDTPRCVAGMDRVILAQLAACGLFSDQTPLYQSTRGPAYDQALQTLIGQGLAYPCACSRADIEAACAAIGQPRSRHAERAYPGTCRQGLRGRPARAWRLRLPAPQRDPAADGAEPPSCPDDDAARVRWQDRRLGAQPGCGPGRR
jgi:glutamyl-Q tRNA(Asp) synthetase